MVLDKIKVILSFFIFLLAQKSICGTLYTFDKNLVVMNALSHVELRYSDLAKKELNARPLISNIDKNGELFVTAFFAYEDKSAKFDTLFVCITVNEHGNLVAVNRDIRADKIFNRQVMPSTSRCLGKP